MITTKALNEARIRLQSSIHVTPVLTSNTLNEKAGAQVFIKAEHLQKTGSFKIRGATNRVTIAKNAGAEHILAASSGNHGQAVAFIARALGLPATIITPEDVSPVKENAIKSYGSEIIHYGTTSQERLDYALELKEKMNAVIIPPYDDQDVIAGQGTIGLEILSQVQQPQIIVVPIGGGGLISGVSAAIKMINPNIKIIGVEPEDANATYLSRRAGKRVSIPTSTSIADGLRSSLPGELTYSLIEKFVDDIVLVTENEIREASFFYMSHMKQVVEPSGATTLAALQNGNIKHNNGNIALIASGGNLNFQKITQLLPQ